MTPIKVPKTPRSSFNTDRRPSTLLLDQIEHLEWAALPAWQRKPRLLARYRKHRVKTEQQAADRIAQLTAMVLNASEDGTPPEIGERPTVVLPRVGRRKKRTSTAAKPRKVRRARAAKPRRARKKAARGRR
jgi:hypothetical protein